MKINSSTVLVGKKVVLVPYKPEHVSRYHDWMQSPELLELTASERLTLGQEYDMQKSWFEDDNKCTFIVLSKKKWMQPECTEIDSMAGDVNLFFNDNNEPSMAEIEVMIAEESCRRQGLGKEAVLMMMNYGVSKLGVTRFSAKIGYQNKPSIALFLKLGFSEVSTSVVFQESTLEFHVSEKSQQDLHNLLSHITEHKYPHTYME